MMKLETQSKNSKLILVEQKKSVIPKNTIILGLGLLLLLLSLVFALSVGAYSLSLSKVWAMLLSPWSGEWPAREHFLLWQIRLPRVLGAMAVGTALALSGAALQGLFRNPLADPGLVGVTSGAMLSAVLFIVLGGAMGLGLSGVWGQFALSGFAFLGGLLSTFLVYRLSSSGGRTFTATMLLSGVALAATSGALAGLLTYFSDESQLRDITFWSLGSLSGITMSQIFLLLPIVFFCTAWLFRLSTTLNALMLGEQEAAYMGIRIENAKRQLIVVVAVLVGVSVAVSGLIGFVGLVAPHIIRLWRGGDHRFLLPASAILGAILLLWADTLARWLIAPAELPIGILTAFIGAPFFFWLILKSKKNNSLWL